MNIKSSKTLVTEALSEIKTISPDEALSMMNEDKCNLIDIRDIRELERDGRVENSNHIPRGMLEFWLDPDSPYFKDGKLDMNKEMVLFCAGGMRSALAAKLLKIWGLKKFHTLMVGLELLEIVNLRLFKKHTLLKHIQVYLVPKKVYC